ncbi:MAG: tetratricopeptide repeat protein [Desulfarculaceae bacterium]|jgi:tetratricopeptide (TPR) repeat protein
MKIVLKAVAMMVLLAVANLTWAAGVDDIRAGNDAARSGNLKKAIELFTKAIKSGRLSKENLAIAYNNRGSAWDDQGRADQAIRDYNKAVKTNPKYAEAYYNRSFAYERKGLFKLALADIKKAASLEPNEALYRERHQYLHTMVIK